MKKDLKEEILRIHELTYGKKAINEDGFLSKVGNFLKKIVDDPKKADLLTSDVEEFYNNIDEAIRGGGLSQQQRGQYTFQKGVESMQIGLILLGYELPRFGVDGKFGPETMTAVSRFNQDNIGDLNINEETMMSPVGPTTVTSDFGPRVLRGKSGVHYGVDMTASVGTKIVAPLDGKVIAAGFTPGDCGGLIKLQHGDNLTTSYCHCSAINVSVGDEVKRGSRVGLTGGEPGAHGSGNSTAPHLHFEVKKNGVAMDPMDFLGSEVELNVLGTSSKLGIATPEMLSRLKELLQQRGVTSDDLKPYIDVYNVEGVDENSFYVKLLENLGAPVSEENLKFLMAWRQSEGGSAKNNPFNTTYNLQGSTNYNEVGVKNYETLKDGLVATLRTLKNGRYDCIVSSLQKDLGADKISQCYNDLKTWGTGNLVNKVVNDYNSGTRPRVPEIA